MSIEQLKILRARTELLWSAAIESAGEVDTTGLEPGDATYLAEQRAAARRTDCEDSRRQAMAAWDRAISAAVRGDVEGAREELGRAGRLARAEGDAPEREALTLLGAHGSS